MLNYSITEQIDNVQKRADAIKRKILAKEIDVNHPKRT